MAVYTWYLLSLWFGCSSDPSEKELSPSEQLVRASDKVIFTSVEQLGPHRSVSTFQRREYRGEGLETEHEEVLQIAWKDWDNFQASRFVDSELVSGVVIADFNTWEYAGSQWIKRDDGELYRVQLRSTWNQWDDVLRHFSDHIIWEVVGEEVLEGRKTQKYVARFTKPEVSKKTLRPLSFQGTVWVDELTAVRILGEVSAELARGSYKKSLRLQVQRTDIGAELEVSPPQELTK